MQHSQRPTVGAMDHWVPVLWITDFVKSAMDHKNSGLDTMLEVLNLDSFSVPQNTTRNISFLNFAGKFFLFSWFLYHQQIGLW